LMNLLFVPFFDRYGYAHVGLALSIGLGACLNAGFLFWGLRRKGIYMPQPGWLKFLTRLAVALALMAGVALGISARFDWIALHTHPLARIAALCLVLALCVATYFGALLLMGFRFRDFKRVAT